MDQEFSSRRALGLVLVSTLGLSLKGIWARLAYAAGTSVSTVLFYRAALSLPLILLCWWLFSRRGVFAGGTIPWRWTHVGRGLSLGVFFSVGMFCDFQSIFYLGAGVSRVVLFGYPLVVLVLDAVVDRKVPSRIGVLGFFVAWVGLVLVCGVLDGAGAARGTHPWSWTHLSWGVASLVLYASYVKMAGKLSVEMGSTRLSLLSNLATCFVVVAVLSIVGAGSAPTIEAMGLLWVGLMVVVSTVVPYFLMMEAIRCLGPARASLTSMVGPVMTLFAGALVLGEALSGTQLFGVVITLLSVMLVQLEAKAPRLGRRITPPPGANSPSAVAPSIQ